MENETDGARLTFGEGATRSSGSHERAKNVELVGEKEWMQAHS